MFAYVPHPFGIFFSHKYTTILFSSVKTGDSCVFMFSFHDFDHVYTPSGFNDPCGVIMLDNKQIVVANYSDDALIVI